jgi:type IV secretion system protein TrbL
MKTSITIIRFIALFSFALILTTIIPQNGICGVSSDVVNQIVNKFYTQSNAWGTILQNYALRLFNLCATLTIVLFGIKSVLHKNNLGSIVQQFVVTLLFCCFILAVIHNYQEWSMNVINGLKKIAGELETNTVNSDSPLQKGYEMATIIIDKASLLNIGQAFGYIVCSIIMMIVFALMTAQIVLIKCEAFIIMNASMLLLGLGGAQIFKNYAINVMRYILATAFKLFVMQLVMGIGLSFIDSSSFTDAGLQDIIIMLGVSVVLLALVKSLPDAIAGVINGSNISTGNALGQAMQQVATGTMAAVGAGVGGALGGAGALTNSISAVRNASSLANESGASGFGKMMSMGKTLYGAHKQARAEGKKPTYSSRMATNVRSRLQEMKMSKMANSMNNSNQENK